jgi:hypothetical protein
VSTKSNAPVKDVDYDEARGDLIGYCLVALPNEPAFDAADRKAGRYEAALLQKTAAEIVASCPEHGPRDEAWIDCHCMVADELRRQASKLLRVTEGASS